MLNKINKLLQNFSVKLIRTAKPVKISRNKSNGNNYIIEFIGAPGVGKSTLCNYYLKHHGLKTKGEIFTRKQIAAIASGLSVEPTGVHDRILNIKLQHDAGISEMTAVKKLRSIQNFRVFVDHDYVIQNYVKDKLIFLDEERLLSYFLDRAELFSKAEIDAYFKNRIFVFCDTSSENILAQIQERAKKGRLIARHQNLTEAELLQDIDQRRAITQERFNKLKDNKVAIIQVDIRAGLEKNTQILDEFLSKTI